MTASSFPILASGAATGTPWSASFDAAERAIGRAHLRDLRSSPVGDGPRDVESLGAGRPPAQPGHWQDGATS